MLANLLSQLDRIYDLELQVEIGQFLISRETCQSLAGERTVGGMVIVHQGKEDEEIELGVYIGEETLAHLDGLDLLQRTSFGPIRRPVHCDRGS